MNASVYSADRATHLKIVVTALVMSIVIMSVALAARLGFADGYAEGLRPGPVQKAGLGGDSAQLLPTRLNLRPI
jgi:hypothetical protein